MLYHPVLEKTPNDAIHDVERTSRSHLPARLPPLRWFALLLRLARTTGGATQTAGASLHLGAAPPDCIVPLPVSRSVVAGGGGAERRSHAEDAQDDRMLLPSNAWRSPEACVSSAALLPCFRSLRLRSVNDRLWFPSVFPFSEIKNWPFAVVCCGAAWLDGRGHESGSVFRICSSL